MGVPVNVRSSAFFGDRSQLTASTKTSDRKKAQNIAARTVAAWKDEIDAARRNQPSRLEKLLTVTLREGADRALDNLVVVTPEQHDEPPQAPGRGRRVQRDETKADLRAEVIEELRAE
jgi:hypothetical protein